MKTICITFCLFLFSLASFSQADGQESEFDLLDLITIKNSSYRFRIQSDGKVFKLKTCLGTEDCKEAYDFIKTMDSDAFLTAVMTQINNEHNESYVLADYQANGADVKVKALLDKVKEYDEKKVRSSLNEAQNLLRTVDNSKTSYSAKIVLNESVPFTSESSSGGNNTFAPMTATTPVSSGIPATTSATPATATSSSVTPASVTPATATSSSVTPASSVTPVTATSLPSSGTLATASSLKIIDAKITFFNNKASSIYIKAELTENGSTEKIIFINNQYSVALRYFNRYGATVTSKRKDKTDITIDYNDVFDYESDENFNYSIANSQVSLSHVKDSKNKPTARVIQRRFFDYFTAVVFSDLMGFNTENSNPLLNAQAKLLLPLNLNNSDVLFSKPGKWTMFRQFTVNTSIALSNSFENENRFISVIDADNVSNFELFKRNNLYGEFGLDIFTLEAKGWFSNISLGYKAKFYRTGFRYTQTQENATDVVTNKQILSVGHGPFLNFEIRPQNNFGADVTLSLEDLNFTDRNTIVDRTFKDDIITEAGREHFVVPYNIISLNASFYWLTNPETAKGGIYANLGGFYHTESKSIFPQFQVGYATNLTSFVNRFKPKPAIEENKED